jgi:hypothetical protein
MREQQATGQSHRAKQARRELGSKRMDTEQVRTLLSNVLKGM